jgi:hypothetical protein
VSLDHIYPMCPLSLSSIHIGMHALILLPKPHTLGKWVHTWFSSRLANDKITTRGYKVLTFVECTTIMIAVLAVTSYLGSSFD